MSKVSSMTKLLGKGESTQVVLKCTNEERKCAVFLDCLNLKKRFCIKVEEY